MVKKGNYPTLKSEDFVGKIINNYRILDLYRRPYKNKNNPKDPNQHKNYVKYECLICGYMGDKCLYGIKNHKCSGCNAKKLSTPALCGEITNSGFLGYIASAKIRGIEFNITPEYLWSLFIQQDRKCYFTDIELEFESCGTRRHFGEFTASPDRIDSTKGYVKGNVQWVHKYVNNFKYTFSSERYIGICNLIHGFDNTNSPCYMYEETKRDKRWKGCGDITGDCWSRIRCGANNREIEFNISIEDAWSVFVNQGGVCYLTGQPIYFARNKKEKRELRNTASLDRIDSSKGYSVENCMWVHKLINNSRWHFDLDYYKEICKLVAVQHPRERSTIPPLETIL